MYIYIYICIYIYIFYTFIFIHKIIPAKIHFFHFNTISSFYNIKRAFFTLNTVYSSDFSRYNCYSTNVMKNSDDRYKIR